MIYSSIFDFEFGEKPLNFSLRVNSTPFIIFWKNSNGFNNKIFGYVSLYSSKYFLSNFSSSSLKVFVFFFFFVFFHFFIFFNLN
jgi:hypothetical protein